MLRDYTIQAVLGHGGFGIVYKARHNELDQVVAIKEYLPSELAVREGATVRAKSADCETYFADGLRRFREEAKALIDFQRHPSTVACSEFFRANGTAYLVMEYVDGQPLSHVLREREATGQPFTESDLLGIAVPLAEGLAHIHRAGVIHRDIKPANILVRRADRQPVLIDFGAAKQAVAEHSRSLAPYTEGYAALEQVADGRLGPWTDLYGYGAVLWRMVAGGNRPWEPPNPVKVESRANARVREADDPLPTAKELGAGRFAEGLLETIDGCLELRDTERLGDTERVVGLLQASGGGEQVSSSVEPPADDSTDSVQPESVSEEAQPLRMSLPVLAADPEFLADLDWLEELRGMDSDEVDAAAKKITTLLCKQQALLHAKRSDAAERTRDLGGGPREAFRRYLQTAKGIYNVARRSFGEESVTLARLGAVIEELESKNGPGRVEPAMGTPRWQRATDVDGNPVGKPLRKANKPRQPVTDRRAGARDTPKRGLRQFLAIAAVLAALLALATAALMTPAQWSFRIEPIPTTATVTLVDGSAPYQPGMPLVPGLYEVEVSAPGYITRRERISHSESPTSHIVVLYRIGQGMPQDFVMAAERYKRACERGEVLGCHLLGVAYYSGEGVEQDKERAAELYMRACEGGYAPSCNSLGFLYRSGEGVGLDATRATALFSQACEGGNATGCYNLGNLYRNGTAWRTPSRRQRRCCNNLGALSGRGEGVGLDASRAAELFSRACEGGVASGCTDLGILYRKGEGVGLDASRAAELFSRACEGGVASGCTDLGILYRKGEGVGLDASRAAELFSRACEGGNATGCINLGLMYYHGVGFAQDRSVAKELFQKACTGGYLEPCEQIESHWR